MRAHQYNNPNDHLMNYFKIYDTFTAHTCSILDNFYYGNDVMSDPVIDLMGQLPLATNMFMRCRPKGHIVDHVDRALGYK